MCDVSCLRLVFHTFPWSRRLAKKVGESPCGSKHSCVPMAGKPMIPEQLERLLLPGLKGEIEFAARVLTSNHACAVHLLKCTILVQVSRHLQRVGKHR